MTKRTKKSSQGLPIWLIFVGLIGFGLIMAGMLQGTDIALFDPKGFIAGEQTRLMVRVVILLLEIAIPTLFLLYYFAWKYRESNEKATYNPDIHPKTSFVLGIWAIPTITMILITSMMWPATHKLAPQRLIAEEGKPLTIQVIALRWKWLFIYPEQNVAAVNYVQIPVNTPVQFELSADEAPMSSFWIPHLAGQLYAMTGHTNRLNVMGDTIGDYTGRSAEINGKGFAGMQFTTRVSSQENFDTWIDKVKFSPDTLDIANYEKLLRPSENNPTAFYSAAENGLYDTVLKKYSGSYGSHTEHE